MTLFVSLIITIGLFAFIRYSDLLNPLTLMLWLWGLIITLVLINPFKWDSVSPYTLFMIDTGLSFYAIGAVASTLIFIIQKKTRPMGPTLVYSDSSKDTLILNYKAITVLGGAALVVSFINAVPSLRLLMQGASLTDIRYIYYYQLNAEINSNSFLAFLGVYVATPVTMLMMPLSAYYLFSGNKRKWYYLACSVALVSMRIVQIGDRFILANLIVSYVVVGLFLVNSTSRRKKRKYIVGLAFVTAIALTGISMITKNRGVNQSFLYIVFKYSSGSVVYLQKIIEQISMLNEPFTFGFTSLNGVLRPFFVIFKHLNNQGQYPYLFNLAQKLIYLPQLSAYTIGNSVKFNGFATMFYDFYADGGIISISVFSFIFGLAAMYTYLNYRAKKHDWVILYSIMCIVIFNSMLDFSFVGTDFGMAFYYWVLFIRKRKQKTRIFCQGLEERSI